MTFKELTYSVWEILSGYMITDDNELTITLIEENMLSMNHTLIREAYNNKRLSQSLYVMDENIPVEKIEKTVTIDGVTVKADGRYCEAKLKELVTGIGDMDLKYLGAIDLSKDYSRKTFRQLVNNEGGTIWTLHTPTYALSGNVAYMDSYKLSGALYVTAIGLWNDPRKASGYDENMDFPTPSEYKLQMLTIQHLLTGKNIPPDVISDAQRQIIPPGRNVQSTRPKIKSPKEEEDARR